MRVCVKAISGWDFSDSAEIIDRLSFPERVLAVFLINPG